MLANDDELRYCITNKFVGSRAAGKVILEEEGAQSLLPSSFML